MTADTKRCPREPTEAMVNAGLARHWPQNMSGDRLALLWRAMFDAAPDHAASGPPCTCDKCEQVRADRYAASADAATREGADESRITSDRNRDRSHSQSASAAPNYADLVRRLSAIMRALLG